MSIKPKMGFCEMPDCPNKGKEVMIRSKKCQYCAVKKFRSYSIPTNKSRKITGEGDLFKTIWAKRPHKCESCGKELGDEMRTFYFSHCVSKGSRPDLRLDENNIFIECLTDHTIWGGADIENKMNQLSFKKKMNYLYENHKPLWQKLQDQIENHKKTA